MHLPRIGARLAACALAFATLVLGGCGSRGDVKRDPNAIVSVVRTDGATMNPLFAQTVEDALVYAQMLYDSLTSIGPDYLPHPRLATSWTHSPDGKTWTVDLRHDVRFSDGVPLTSKDVVYSYRAYMDPKTAAISGGDLGYVTSVRAEGPYRVIFKLAHPSAVFVGTAMGNEFSILPEHVLSRTPHERLRFTPFGEHPVGTGPFMLSRWQHDVAASFVPNPYAWRKPHISRFDVRVIFNDQSEIEAVANASADLIDDMSSTQYRQLQRVAPNVDIMTFDSLYLDAIQPNVERPGLNDVAVRKAMMYGQDRDAVVRGIFFNQVNVSDGLIPSALKAWYEPHVIDYAYDPTKARAILDAAGWKLGADGVRRRGNTRLAFEMLLNQGSATLTDMMLSYIADMKAIGIDVALRQLDFASIIARQFKGTYDLTAIGFGGSVDPDLYTTLDSSQTPPAGANTSRFKDPKLDRVLRAGLVELDLNKRRAIYSEMQKIIADKLPILYLYGRFASLAHSKRLILDKATTLQSPLLYYNIDEWKVAP